MFSHYCKHEWKSITSSSTGWALDDNPGLLTTVSATGKKPAGPWSCDPQGCAWLPALLWCAALQSPQFYFSLCLVMTCLKLPWSHWEDWQSLMAFGSGLWKCFPEVNNQWEFSPRCGGKKISFFSFFFSSPLALPALQFLINWSSWPTCG